MRIYGRNRRRRRPAIFAKCANALSQRLSIVTLPSEPDSEIIASFERRSVGLGTRVGRPRNVRLPIDDGFSCTSAISGGRQGALGALTEKECYTERKPPR